jgi:hypothetical protein
MWGQKDDKFVNELSLKESIQKVLIISNMYESMSISYGQNSADG